MIHLQINGELEFRFSKKRKTPTTFKQSSGHFKNVF